MMREVQGSGPVCNSFGLNHKHILGGDRIGDENANRARITFFTVATAIGETERARSVRGIDRCGGPDFLVKALDASVEMIGSFVTCQLVCFSVQIESSPSDATCHTPYDGPEVGMACYIGVEIVETQYNISQTTISIRHEQSRYDATVGDGLHFQAAWPGHRPCLD